MHILQIDIGKVGLPFALRCQDAGHKILTWMPVEKGAKRCEIGDGMIEKLEGDWQKKMGWADLIVCTDNNKYANELEVFHRQGYPIIGASKEAAALELDRAVGQEVMKEAGLEVAEFEEFSSYDKAIAYVKKEKKTFVSKPWGGAADKSLSYVPKTPEDLICRLERWKTEGIQGKFILQEMVEGSEMAVGAWFGKAGFSRWRNENWEEKRLMNDGIGPNCYSADTEVLTQTGWKLFSDVTLNDLVASYNPTSRKIFFEKPTQIHWTDYEGPMYSFNNRYLDLLVTPTHNMWAARRKTHAWRFYAAQDCPSEFDVLQAAEAETDELGPVKLSDGTEIDPNSWMELLGLYLSEGYVDLDRPRVRICQNPGVKQELMLESLRKSGFDWHASGNKISTTHAALADYLRQFGHSHDKFIPNEVFIASARQKRLFLTAFNFGDGDLHYGRYRYVSGSSRLIGDIQALLCMLGVASTVTVDTRQFMVSPLNGKTYEAQPVYSLEETTREKVSVRQRSVLLYKGKIGCVTVPTTHLLVVRRNGRTAICGNTGEMGTIMRYVQKSKLFDDVLAPFEEKFDALNYRGYVDVNCIVGADGTPYPLEFTMRFGWPHFNLAMALHKGDPADYLAGLVEGRDVLDVSTEVCCGVVMAMGDYPWDQWPIERVSGWPIRGLTGNVRENVSLSSTKMGMAPVMIAGEIREREVVCSAGSYVLIVTGTGKTVDMARGACYETVDKINWPPHKIYRTDIGCRLEGDLKELQKHGYARGMKYGD